MRSDISKNQLYEGVKSLYQSLKEKQNIHLSQHKLYTLYSIAFQCLMFESTKNPGAYIIRIENNLLNDKLTKKSKDQTTRNFMQRLNLPRKLKYQKSIFYLDFFNVATWSMTNEINPSKIKGSLIVKNTNNNPMMMINDEDEEETVSLPSDYYYSTLMNVCDQNIIISHEDTYENFHEVTFPFIKKEEKSLAGVKISDDIIFSEDDC